VSYWEPAKWIAKLRTLNQSDRPVLLKVNMGSGHFGASGRYEYLRETAFHDAFLLDVLEIPAEIMPNARHTPKD
jgi:oligopeptidase B